MGLVKKILAKRLGAGGLLAAEALGHSIIRSETGYGHMRTCLLMTMV